ncbi:MAG: hypothetical protein NZ108_03020 [Bacteroidia bacterium]|nr:hypothetical protein [Bacteroidia bacterium]
MLHRITELQQENQQQAEKIKQLTIELAQKKQELAEQKWKQTLEDVSVRGIDNETKEILLEKIEMLLQDIEDCIAIVEKEEN